MLLGNVRQASFNRERDVPDDSMSAATTANAPGAVTIQVKHRGLLTACAMLATLMQIVDSTIANVALPHIQGSLSTTLDQVMWVLTFLRDRIRDHDVALSVG